jgi:CopG family transcriptional regulator, nickel-responsive regulator
MSKVEETIRFTVSLPRPLLDELDRRLVHQGYASRSELVRDLIRERSGRGGLGGRRPGGRRGPDHRLRPPSAELTQHILDIQHRQFVHVVASTHVHMDHHNCLETIIIRGRPAEIERLSLEIGGLKGVRFSDLTRASRLGH